MADKTRKNIKMEYFNVVCRSLEDMNLSNTPDNLFDLYSWINLFDKEFNDIEDRTFLYAGEKARLDDFYKSDDYWVLDFLRLRDSNLPKMAYENRQAKDLQLADDEYMGEEAIAIYDPTINVLALQRNRNSLSVSGIEKYLNETWKHRDGNVIYLRPILSDVNIDTIQKNSSKYCRKIRLKVADIGNTQDYDYNNSSLGQLLNITKRYNGVYADITISMGHFKNRGLNDAAINSTLDELKNDPNVSKAELYLKDDDASPVEIVDLLSNKLYDYIQIEYELKKSIPSNVLVYNLLNKYRQKQDKIAQLLGLS